MLYALAFPQVGAKALAWVALVPLLFALRTARIGRALALGWLWSVLAGTGVGTWMPAAVARYLDQPFAVGLASLVFVASTMAGVYYAAFAAVAGRLLRAGGVLMPLWIGAAWAAAELARGRLLNGDLLELGSSTWATLGYALAGVDPLVQLASATGVYGLSFLLAAGNAGLAGIVFALAQRQRAWREAAIALALAAALVVAAAAFGARELRAIPAAGPGVAIAVAQGNLDAAERWGAGGAARSTDVYLRLTREALGQRRAAVVFWPEAALTFFLEQEPLYREAISLVLREEDAELVVGAPRSAPGGGAPYWNSVYALDPQGVIRASYDKQLLIPFLEYFPAGVDLLRRSFGPIRAFERGASGAPLPTRAGAAGVLVCNEAMVPQLAGERMQQGAVFLVNPSNDQWVPDRGFALQQFEIVSLRAIEQRAWLVRASTSGPSALIDPWGRSVARTEPFTRAAFAATLGPPAPRSLYGRVGDLFGALCVLALVIRLLAPGRRGATPLRQP